jgi:hypothetical protein
MPGTDPRESIAIVLGELPELPYLPELPARGPGADLIGRTAGLLVDMPVETTPRGWKLAARPGRDAGRAASYLSADLDTMEEAAEGFTGTFKIQACGPWTLAASLELSRSLEPALADEGAVADLTGSLAEGLAAHVNAVRRRLPGATILLRRCPACLPGRCPPRAACTGFPRSRSQLSPTASAPCSTPPERQPPSIAARRKFPLIP